MRIIAGKFRSRILHMVPSTDTRSTQDKVRGAVFNSLSDRVQDATVLDLFAGSGAYGFESISRGASKILFNDKERIAVKIIMQNVDLLGVKEQTEIWNYDYQKALQLIADNHASFDLIFLDPPYRLDIYESVINTLSNHINVNGIIVAEMETKRTIDFLVLTNVTCYKEATYGSKKILYFRKK